MLPIAYDVEESQIINNLDANTVTNMILTFCEKVRDAGYLPMLYSYRSMIQTSMNLTDLQEEGILIWEAYWPTQPDFTQKQSLPGHPGVAPDIWQYTFDGNVPGANTSSGQVDLNLIYMDSPLGQMLGGGDLLVRQRGGRGRRRASSTGTGSSRPSPLRSTAFPPRARM